ncbi:hypothetical protein [Listeria fleischmannii]|uniref:hypothetical protein n=1 Tax=Listeria fleischmannii TaxID=1069827 RepID=UPI000FE14AE8|nr:hypothetical protein [Listeria fleischmannii]
MNAVDKDGKTYIFSELKDLINFEAVEAALRGEPSENAAIDSRKQALIDERDKYVAYIKKLKADKAREGIIVDEKWLNSRGLSDVE